MQYSAIQYNTKQYTTMKCNTIQCNTVQYTEIPYSAVQCSAVPYAMKYNNWSHSRIIMMRNINNLKKYNIYSNYDYHPLVPGIIFAPARAQL